MAHIDWLLVSESPDGFKDGRVLLMWCDGRPVLGYWDRTHDGSDWHYDWFDLEGRQVKPLWMAEVNAPRQ